MLEYKRVLIVEDDSINALITRHYVEKAGYQVSNVVDDGEKALQEIEKARPDLILMDIKINGDYDGIETAQRIQSQFSIPIIYLTAYTNEEILNRAKKTKPYGYIIKPIDEKLLTINMEMALYKHQAEQSIIDMNKVLDDTVDALARTIEFRDPYTSGHQKRVSKLACTIAQSMDLSEMICKGLHIAGILHDIGKIVIPSEILSKPNRLSRIELELIKQHPQAGYDIIKNISFPWPVAAIVLQHHERMNGSGYPNRLRENDIIIEARIMAVADVVEAMSSHRPYRPSLGLTAALDEIQCNRGILYDPEVVDCCLRVFAEQQFNFD
ncbi:MAG: response regulator [Candidatus Delongbacteria bacterium]|nr:response regulator [Candidatus Delongbacteria bacterium]